MPAWRQKLASFWRWWTDELAQVAPERFASLRGVARVPQLALEGDDLVLVEPRSAAGSDARVALATLDPQRCRLAVRSLLERAGETRGRVRVSLSHDEALVRRVYVLSQAPHGRQGPDDIVAWFRAQFTLGGLCPDALGRG